MNRHIRSIAVLALLFGGAVLGTAHYEVAAGHETHVVLQGETVAGIALSHGVAEAQIRRANGIPRDGVIYAGTQLRLSGRGFVASLEGTAHYRLESDDTLEHLASHLGITAHELSHLNDADASTLISSGTSIHVPRRWVCPVTGGRFFNDWGFPRAAGRFHTGTDLFAPRGTPVQAPVGGVVTQVTGTVGGYQFVLHGEDGNTYLGSHMDRFGESGTVVAGTVIGYVGDSGNARGSEPHLHFEIHPGDGQSENPYPSLLANGC